MPEQAPTNEVEAAAEANPERIAEAAVESAVESVEAREAAATDSSPSRWRRARESLKKEVKSGVGFAVDFTRSGVFTAFKIIKSLLKFAWEAYKKKGDVGFKAGYDIGAEAFDFRAKKEKKE